MFAFDSLRTKCKKITTLVRYFFYFKGIVICAPYPHEQYLEEGFFQRIKAIDLILSDLPRLYVECGYFDKQPSRAAFDKIDENCAIVRYTRSRWKTVAVRLFAWCCILKSRKLYMHVVWYMRPFLKAFHLPFIRKYLDIHGVPSEECRLEKKYHAAYIHEQLEALGIQKSTYCIVVTNAMEAFYKEKYQDMVGCDFLILPIVPDMGEVNPQSKSATIRPTIVYAGNASGWQQLPKMAEVVAKTAQEYSYRIFCNPPEAFSSLLPDEVLAQIELGQKSHKEILAIYPDCHYGFVLRADDIVNKVACPTKLVEYLAFGVIPIVDTPDIGDFSSLGMRYLTVEQLLRHDLPTDKQRMQMVQENRACYEALRMKNALGAENLRELLSGSSSTRSMR